MRFKASGVLLPGLFLLILGFGNLMVGYSKQGDYQDVLAKLAEHQPRLETQDLSALSRIQTERQSAFLLSERRQQTSTKLGFYRLVILGGKVMIALSIPFLLLSIILRLRKGRGDSSVAAEANK